MTGAAKALALAVAEDTEHDLVVVDLPAGAPAAVWGSVADTLPDRRRGVRLVVGGRSRETSALAGQWLADRLGRTVIAHDGAVIPAAGGALFVHSGRDTGWVRFEPGGPPRFEAKRFPRPSWDSEITAELTPTSALGVAEPLPSGLWIRPVGAEAPQREQRARLIELSPQQPDILSIVLGSPGGPALTLDDVARIWIRLPARIRPHTRFVGYGPMTVPAGSTLGQALADLLDEEIAVYTGLPVGSAAAPTMRTVRADGTLGWAPFAQELGYRPDASAGVPALRGHRAPLPDLWQVAPTVYWYAPDAVLEVVQSGLVVRPPADGPHTLGMRAIPPGPDNLVAFDGPNDAAVERMRGLAEDLAARLEPALRQATRVAAAADLVGERTTVRAGTAAAARIDEPTQLSTVDELPVTEVLRRQRPASGRPTEVDGPPAFVAPVELAVSAPVETSASAEPVAAQTFATPQPEAAALLPTVGIAEEREWLRRTLGQEYGTLANAVSRVLSEHPGFQGALSRSPADVLTDAVAVRLYLSEAGAAVDTGLRGGTVGPHVPLARCVVSGLGRLPSHRGATTFAATPSPARWARLRERPLLTEWGFVTALTGPCANLPGDTDVLIWSMTARRTRLLEPETGGVADRVLFVPGTRFTVLELAEPAAGTRGRILLRELASGEADETALDGLARTALGREMDSWAETPRPVRVAAAGAARFGALPGLEEA
jgi:hypothetical protein